MIVSISNVAGESLFVVAIFVAALLLSARLKSDPDFFSPKVTAELKGLAIFGVVFSHIGYFLVSDHKFLTPFSNYGGVGVDLFLILSGYGLVASALRKPLTRLQFYKKRISKIYLPVLLAVFLFLLADAAVFRHFYPFLLTLKNLFGFFPHADLYQDIDSPLWFITPLLFYYLLFPLIFWKRTPLLSAIFVGLLGWAIVHLNLQNIIHITGGVANLYLLHFLAFPIGMAGGALINMPPRALLKAYSGMSELLDNSRSRFIARWILFAASLGGLSYTLLNTHVGEGWKTEEVTSIASALLFLIIFIFKKFEFKLFWLFGIYSFEIYLLHWPMLYRYNFIYGRLPAGASTLLSLILILAASYIFNKAASLLIYIFTAKQTRENSPS